MRIVFEDDDRTTGGLRVDYLAINVTVSPLSDNFVNLTNTTDFLNITNGLNFTRHSPNLNVSAHWNASSVSVVDGALVMNDSNTGTLRVINVSESPGYSAVGYFAGNCTNFTFNFTNTSLFRVAGNYTVWMRSWDSFYQQNTSTDKAWFGLLGYAGIYNATSNETGNEVLPGGPIRLSCQVLDRNTTWPVSGHNVTFYNSSDYIGWNLTNASGFAVHDYTAPDSNQTVYCNITDQPGLFYSASETNNQSMVVAVVSDTSPPIVNSIRFRYRNVTTNTTNLFANLSIITNVTDNRTNATTITSVSVMVNYPNGMNIAQPMNQNSTSQDMWFIYFNTTNHTLPINETGNYSVYITAYDEASNYKLANSSNIDNTNFTANYTYIIRLASYNDSNTIYNRGEGLVLRAYDVNGLVIDSVNWTVNITKYNNTAWVYNDSNMTVNSTYFITENDSVGNWSLLANVSDSFYGLNNGSLDIDFNVTNILVPHFIVPAAGTQYIVGQNMNSVDNGGPIKLRVNYSRGINTNYTINMTLKCRLSNTSIIKSINTPDYIMTQECLASNTAGAFYRYVNVSDYYNNTGFGSVLLTAKASSSPGDNNNGGNGGGGGIVTPLTNCSCSTWQNVDCGPTGSCDSGYMYQTRACDPAGCDNETQCIRARVCDLIRAFNITVDKEQLEIATGNRETAVFSFTNTGEANITLNLTITVDRDCCEVSFLHKLVNITVQSSIDQALEIHPALSQEPGKYEIKLAARYGFLEKEQSIIIDVVENPAIGRLESLFSEYDMVAARIEQFRQSGVSTAELEAISNQIKSLLRDSEALVSGDRINELKDKLETAESDINNIKGQLTTLEFQKLVLDNKWWILLAIFVVIVVYYAMFQVLLPLRRLVKDINAMDTNEKAMVKKRKEIEMQYFQGKMNQQAFNDMIIGEQSKILGIRGKYQQKVEEKKQLIRDKLSPIGILRWLVSGPVRLARKISRKSHKPKTSKKMKVKEAPKDASNEAPKEGFKTKN